MCVKTRLMPERSNKYTNPLPPRRGFWSRALEYLADGRVLCDEGDIGVRRDNKIAAQSVLIDEIGRRLMKTFTRPQLPEHTEFYKGFYQVYENAVQETDNLIWEKLCDEFDEEIKKKNGTTDLSKSEAAYLTYAFTGIEEAPQSYELYLNLALFARAYEQLLRTKYDSNFTYEHYYTALRNRMPEFLLRLTSMDSLVLFLLRVNAEPHEENQRMGLHAESIIDPRLLTLHRDESFNFRNEYVDLVHKHILAHNLKDDFRGRTESRGCPVLRSSIPRELYDFAVEELIAQHKMRFGERG